VVPRLGQRLCLAEHVGAGQLAAGHLQDALDELPDLALGKRALEQVGDLALREGDHGGHRLQRQAHLHQLLDEGAVLVDVDLDQADAALGGAHHLFQRRRQRLAGAAPGRPEVHEHRHLARGLDDVGHEGALVASP
jgi:hypothetical protein